MNLSKLSRGAVKSFGKANATILSEVDLLQIAGGAACDGAINVGQSDLGCQYTCPRDNTIYTHGGYEVTQ